MDQTTNKLQRRVLTTWDLIITYLILVGAILKEMECDDFSVDIGAYKIHIYKDNAAEVG